MKLAYADRSRYMGDPDYSAIPVPALIDKAYANRLRARIKPDRATPSADIAPGVDLDYESSDTTHYTVADADGNVVANTYTLNFSFGNHIAVPGTGMLLNNEMADFAAKPGVPNAFRLIESEANRIEGGKRPLSSMSPTMVFKDGKPWIATGSSGGSIIITAVLQTLLNAMDFDMNIASAAASARVHHQWMPDRLGVEQGVSPDTRRLLEQMGHPVTDTRRTLGRTQSIYAGGRLTVRRHRYPPGRLGRHLLTWVCWTAAIHCGACAGAARWKKAMTAWRPPTRNYFTTSWNKPADQQLLDNFASALADAGACVDLGCGPGHVTRYLHERGVDIEGIDLSEGMLKMARKLNPGIRFSRGDLRALGAPDHHWAAAVAFYSLIHIPRKNCSPPCWSTGYWSQEGRC